MNKKPTVILIGGTYGSGKSTIADLISAYITDIDHPLKGGCQR